MEAATTAETVAALWFTAFFALCGLALIISEASGALKRRQTRSKDNDS